jgi:hypothetical protein
VVQSGTQQKKFTMCPASSSSALSLLRVLKVMPSTNSVIPSFDGRDRAAPPHHFGLIVGVMSPDCPRASLAGSLPVNWLVLYCIRFLPVMGHGSEPWLVACRKNPPLVSGMRLVSHNLHGGATATHLQEADKVAWSFARVIQITRTEKEATDRF